MPSVCGSSQAVVADQRLGVGLRQPAARILAASEPLQHRPSFRFERTDCWREFNHWMRRVPHALKVRLELSGGLCVANYDQIVVLSSLATQTEIRRSGSEQLTINLVRLQMHERGQTV